MDLASLGIFLSSLILSVGGFVAVVGDTLRRSKCTSIVCPCSRCTRAVEVEQPTVTCVPQTIEMSSSQPRASPKH